MSTQKWLEIIEEAAELGVEEWHIAGGGEPLFLPERTLKCMERIKRHGMYGILTNNGTQFDQEKVKRVIDMGWDVIHFSIDGPNSKVHDYLRGKNGAFRKATRSIKNFQKFKRSLRLEKPEIRVNTVLSTENYRRLPEMVEYLNELDVSYWFVEPLIVYSEKGEELKLSKGEIKEFKDDIYPDLVDKCERYNIGNNFESVRGNLGEDLISGTNEMQEVVQEDSKKEKGIFSVPCYQPFFHLVIKCDGKVNFCDVFSSDENVKDKSLDEIWYGEYMTKVRREIMDEKLPGKCGKCNPSNTTQRRRYREEMKKIAGRNKLDKLKEGLKGGS